MTNTNSLHRDIMNIPCKEPEHYQDAAVRMAYRVGHRDARHVAAGIATATPRDAPIDDRTLRTIVYQIDALEPGRKEENAQAAMNILRRAIEQAVNKGAPE